MIRPVRFLGIDPGDRWVGIAVLREMSGTLRGQSYTIDTHGKLLIDVADEIARFIESSNVVVCEDFSTRPLGFNRFSRGHTLRLLGAIEVEAYRSSCIFDLVPPDSPSKATQLWTKCRPDFFTLGARQRTHSISAWRALGQWALANDMKILTRFQGDVL